MWDGVANDGLELVPLYDEMVGMEEFEVDTCRPEGIGILLRGIVSSR